MIDTTRIRFPLAGLLLVGLLPLAPLHAQREFGGVPVSHTRALRHAAPTVALPRVDNAELLREDERTGTPGALRFGYAHEVELTFGNAGVWEDLPDGGRVWRLRLASNGAHSLGFLFSRFQLPPGAELFVTNDQGRVLRGAYTHFNHQPNGQFAIQPTPGSALTLEYFEPAGAPHTGQLGIGAVIHDYRGVLPMLRQRAGGTQAAAGACNVDVACPAGAPFADQIDATVHIINGIKLCSGVLLNNTSENGRQIILTAEHCSNLDNAIFVFNYENSGCGSGTANKNDSVTGSVELAVDDPLDFRLAEITAQIPESYDVYLAGWDRSDVPPSDTIAIHHPQGDPKKISFDDDPPVATGTWWNIVDWEIGTTEPGSSGSGLFSPAGLVIGQLSHGAATCANPFDDYYGRMAAQWSLVAPFLDPLGTGQTTLGGFDPNLGTGNPVDVTAITPSNIPSLMPGPGQNVELLGTGFSDGLTVEVNGTPLAAGTFTRRTAGRITVDMPQLGALGPVSFTVREGTDSDTMDATLVGANPPAMQCGTGVPGNYIFSSTGLHVLLGGQPGELHTIYYSTSPIPSVHPLWQLEFGNQFTEAVHFGIFAIDGDGWIDLNVGVTGISFTTFYTQSTNLSLGAPFPTSNLQEFFVFL